MCIRLLLIDTPAELRLQLVRERIPLVHAVLFTHHHADHVFGLDDVRMFPRALGGPLPIYCEPDTEAFIRRSFAYAAWLRANAATSDLDEGVGTGVVIVDTGVLLTNLHVVSDSEKVVVEFADGHESDAVVLKTMPENDLAVLQAKSLPKDGLVAATLLSTSDLRPGDQVVAVGFQLYETELPLKESKKRN